jgi:hypothetical protein
LDGATEIAVGAADLVLGMNADAPGAAALVPAMLTAETRTLYAVPFVRPVRAMALAVVVVEVQDDVPSTAYSTLYPVIDDPPSDTGALQVTLMYPSPATPVTF